MICSFMILDTTDGVLEFDEEPAGTSSPSATFVKAVLYSKEAESKVEVDDDCSLLSADTGVESLLGSGPPPSSLSGIFTVANLFKN